MLSAHAGDHHRSGTHRRPASFPRFAWECIPDALRPLPSSGCSPIWACPIPERFPNVPRENLILHRKTHLHQLSDKLGEERVRRVIEPILAGIDQPDDISDDDLDYARDLGLIKAEGEPELRTAFTTRSFPGR